MVSTVIVATVPSMIWAHESRRPRVLDISSDCVDWRRKLRQRIISSVVDWRRKPRAIKISSVVVDCRLFRDTPVRSLNDLIIRRRKLKKIRALNIFCHSIQTDQYGTVLRETTPLINFFFSRGGFSLEKIIYGRRINFKVYLFLCKCLVTLMVRFK